MTPVPNFVTKQCKIENIIYQTFNYKHVSFDFASDPLQKGIFMYIVTIADFQATY